MKFLLSRCFEPSRCFGLQPPIVPYHQLYLVGHNEVVAQSTLEVPRQSLTAFEPEVATLICRLRSCRLGG